MYEIARNSKKIRTYSSLRSSKVILGVNRKPVLDFLLVINSNFRRISRTVFEILTLSSKISCFYTLPCLTPHSGGMPWDIFIIYTPLKSTFSGLQFCRRHYGSIIHLAVVASQNREIRRNSDKRWPYSPPFYCLRPPLEGNPLKYRDEIWHQKTRIMWLATRWCRNHDASFLRFDTIPARVRRTDGQTDRPGLELSGGWGVEPPVCLQTLIFEWKSAKNFNPWAKFQTFRQLTPPQFL